MSSRRTMSTLKLSVSMKHPVPNLQHQSLLNGDSLLCLLNGPVTGPAHRRSWSLSRVVARAQSLFRNSLQQRHARLPQGNCLRPSWKRCEESMLTRLNSKLMQKMGRRMQLAGSQTTQWKRPAKRESAGKHPQGHMRPTTAIARIERHEGQRNQGSRWRLPLLEGRLVEENEWVSRCYRVGVTVKAFPLSRRTTVGTIATQAIRFLISNADESSGQSADDDDGGSSNETPVQSARFDSRVQQPLKEGDSRGKIAAAGVGAVIEDDAIVLENPPTEYVKAGCTVVSPSHNSFPRCASCPLDSQHKFHESLFHVQRLAHNI